MDEMLACFGYFKVNPKSEADKYKIKLKLQKLAHKLNNGEKINWKDEHQTKFFISYEPSINEFILGYTSMVKYSDQIYCLSSRFVEEAVQYIGREKLLKLFK